MSNQNKQIRDLRKQLNIEKAKNKQLQDEVNRLQQNASNLKERKRISDADNWYDLIGKKTYESEKRRLVRWAKRGINFGYSYVKFLCLKRSDIRGTHVSFTWKKAIPSTLFSTFALTIFCIAIHVTFPNLFPFLWSLLNKFPLLLVVAECLLKFVFIMSIVGIAKILQVMSFEIDASNDEEYIDSMLNASNRIIKYK